MALRFGTDGIRGRAHVDLTVEDVETLAIAAGRVLGADRAAIAADTRESGPAFVDALCRGFARVGVTPWVLGVAPTPAAAHVAATHDAIGAVVSASHNPWHDNGIKFFAVGGSKLSDDQQRDLEGVLVELDGTDPGGIGDPTTPERVDRPDLVADYVDATLSAIEGRTLGELDIVIDTANGAASSIARGAFERLGATVHLIAHTPDGRNINEGCGSTSLDLLSETVRARRAHFGLAFDGDADRVLAVDDAGALVDGDQIIAMCALDMHARGSLADDTVVVTVMTNLGFRQAMAEAGITVHETPVGDRHVLAALEAGRWSLGGEQSGHVIFREFATTGDGLLTAVVLADVVARSGRPLGELARAAMRRLPQRLRNVRVVGSAEAAMAAIAPDIDRVAAALGDTGRLLVRPSGTEPLIRVMAEAPTQADADAAVDDLVCTIEEAFTAL